jgi:hypothetical protein
MNNSKDLLWQSILPDVFQLLKAGYSFLDLSKNSNWSDLIAGLRQEFYDHDADSANPKSLPNKLSVVSTQEINSKTKIDCNFIFELDPRISKMALTAILASTDNYSIEMFMHKGRPIPKPGEIYFRLAQEIVFDKMTGIINDFCDKQYFGDTLITNLPAKTWFAKLEDHFTKAYIDAEVSGNSKDISIDYQALINQKQDHVEILFQFKYDSATKEFLLTRMRVKNDNDQKPYLFTKKGELPYAKDVFKNTANNERIQRALQIFNHEPKSLPNKI